MYDRTFAFGWHAGTTIGSDPLELEARNGPDFRVDANVSRIEIHARWHCEGIGQECRLDLSAFPLDAADRALSVLGTSPLRLPIAKATAGEWTAEVHPESPTLRVSGTLRIVQFEPMEAPAVLAPDGDGASRVAVDPWGVPVGWALAAVVTALLLIGRSGFSALGAAAALLYARVRRSAALDHPLRERIVSLVDERPGIAATEVARVLKCDWCTLWYHLRVLVRLNLLQDMREGRHRRLFTPGRVPLSDRAAVALLENASSRPIVHCIRETPGILQRELARAAGLSPATVVWHVRRLLEAGLIVKAKTGARVRYYPSAKLQGWSERFDSMARVRRGVE